MDNDTINQPADASPANASPANAESGPDCAGSSLSPGNGMRRRTLMLGAVATSAIVSIRPALAQTAGSVLNCSIPVPQVEVSPAATSYNAAGQSTTTAGTTAPARTFDGNDVKRALGGRHLPGTTREQSDAYMDYIRKLQRGQSGFTCYASLQMPGR